jgi:MtN3 and saliva related transmembrane protein
MGMASIIGGLAALASMASFGPQAWRVIRTRNTRDLSTGAYSLTVAAFALWIVYGFIMQAWPLLLSNGVCVALSAFILCMKLLPQASKRAVANAIDPKNSSESSSRQSLREVE